MGHALTPEGGSCQNLIRLLSLELPLLEPGLEGNRRPRRPYEGDSDWVVCMTRALSQGPAGIDVEVFLCSSKRGGVRGIIVHFADRYLP